MLKAIFPDPVPKSKITGFLILFLLHQINVFSTISSVSGLGIRVCLFTKNLSFQNSLYPII